MYFEVGDTNSMLYFFRIVSIVLYYNKRKKKKAKLIRPLSLQFKIEYRFQVIEKFYVYGCATNWCNVTTAQQKKEVIVHPASPKRILFSFNLCKTYKLKRGKTAKKRNQHVISDFYTPIHVSYSRFYFNLILCSFFSPQIINF